jgi:hypothetical protein
LQLSDVEAIAGCCCTTTDLVLYDPGVAIVTDIISDEGRHGPTVWPPKEEKQRCALPKEFWFVYYFFPQNPTL